MSSVLHPVGPEDKKTYWRRRLVAIVVLLVVIVLAVAGIRALTSDDASAEPAHKIDPSQVATSSSPATDSASASPTDGSTGIPTDSPTDGATDSPTGSGTDTTSATTTAASAGACSSSALKLTLTSDATTYGPGRTPKSALTVENTSQSACSVETGSGVRTFTVTDSGGARVWSSADCQTQGASDVFDLDPGAKRAMTGTWTRQRSASGCPTSSTQAAVEAGSYTVDASWKGTTADALTFSLSG